MRYLLLVALLSGCGGGAVLTSKPDVDKEVTVTQSAIRLGGPEGFCVDKTLSKFAAQSAFVLFGNCAAIGGSESLAQPETHAVVTVSVADANGGPKIAETTDELVGFFGSEPGLRALSRDGQPGSVQLVESFSNKGAVFLRARDTSEGNIPGAGDTFWRGFLDARSSVVVVTVIGFDDQSSNRDAHLKILQGFVARIGSQTRTQNATGGVLARLFR